MVYLFTFFFLDGSCIENRRSYSKSCTVGPEFGRHLFSAEVLLHLEGVSCYCDALRRQQLLGMASSSTYASTLKELGSDMRLQPAL